MTEPPRRLRPRAAQRNKTITTQTKGAPSAKGSTAAARPVTTKRHASIYVPPANKLVGLSRMAVSFDVPDVTTWTSGGFSDWTVDEVVGGAIRIRAGTSQIGMFESGIYAVTLTLGVGGMDAASPDCSIRADASLGWTPMATPYIGCGMRGGDTNFAIASASATYFHPGDGSETGVAIEINNLDTVNVDAISVTFTVQQVVR